MGAMVQRNKTELEEENAALRARAAHLERLLAISEETCSLLRSQNDFMSEVMSASVSDAPTIPAPAPPKPISERPTRPSAPRAIRLSDLATALEASETARRERQ